MADALSAHRDAADSGSFSSTRSLALRLRGLSRCSCSPALQQMLSFRPP